MKHLINQLTFEINCSSEDQALGLRHNFAQTLQLKMEEGIDRICSRYSDTMESIRIDKLEIDLGLFNDYTFSSQILDIFLYKFERALQKELAKIPLVNSDTSLNTSDLDGLIYFLETGQMAWWHNNPPTDLNHWFIKCHSE